MSNPQHYGSCLIAIWWWLRYGGYLTVRWTRWNRIKWITWPHFGWMPEDSDGKKNIIHFAPNGNRHISPPLIFKGRIRRGD